MKHKDVIPGEAYAYSDRPRSPYYHGVRKVTVVTTDVEVQHGFGRASFPGVRVREANGYETDVKAEKLLRTWAEHEQREAEIRKARECSRIAHAEYVAGVVAKRDAVRAAWPAGVPQPHFLNDAERGTNSGTITLDTLLALLTKEN